MKNIKNVILLIVCFIFLSGCNQENETEVQEYIKEKHVNRYFSFFENIFEKKLRKEKDFFPNGST
ncbi:hypothetical protein COI41_31110 [Bacillus toyonensis]|uniref:hypothetical protein n=1 Tax=Bacillus toyonensis TaxID=155322 RepID=UPI000BEFF738|nr:hypothetical protein [Bacillus toyonensis]PEO55842.1 hypothetical protein CN567_29755 [Bacillus toyonensis]PFX73546.1 hypothetical protein COL38_30975 [Bacillus toyonensis]PFX79092.1 hypothetical protein COL37_23760 [Bacillus toyonensis]PGA96641.1 hypothetical protein COL98_31520 [Bacillus toyonensis]PHF45752.1 hypothetical protein COI41_31110 [Bacillus toyonensis]